MLILDLVVHKRNLVKDHYPFITDVLKNVMLSGPKLNAFLDQSCLCYLKEFLLCIYLRGPA